MWDLARRRLSAQAFVDVYTFSSSPAAGNIPTTHAACDRSHNREGVAVRRASATHKPFLAFCGNIKSLVIESEVSLMKSGFSSSFLGVMLTSLERFSMQARTSTSYLIFISRAAPQVEETHFTIISDTPRGKISVSVITSFVNTVGSFF